MIFKFLNATPERAFAESIVAEYDRLRRSAALREERPEKARQKLAKLAQRIDAYCREHRPNLYKKARLMQFLQNGLRDKGAVPEEITAFLNEAMVRPLRGEG
ncbi:MAG TPA: hypothetical protein VLT92_00755 [Burkholderiales bacterium]|nr:hypothetical protein [Burkholderiales bacterium]